MESDSRREFARFVVERLREAGFEALWAGGCVRDLLLGRSPSDYDVATSAPPEAVTGLFRRTIPVGVSFGVVRVRGPVAGGEVEVATFRSDGEYRDGRHPETVTFGDARRDAERRDFTINGMFLDPASREVIDYVGGRADLEAKRLRAIGDPVARFTEDKLRLIRAVRFAARFDLAIEPATWSALVAMAPTLPMVAAERIAEELRKILVHPSRSQASDLAERSDLLRAVLPDVARLREEPGGLWDRTRKVLDHLPADPSATLAFAALLYRVGGPTPSTPGQLNTSGRAIAERVARELKLANADRERIAWLVEHRSALNQPTTLRLSQLKRLLAAPEISDLLALHRAIAQAENQSTAHVDWCESYLRDQPDGPINPPPLLTGHDLTRHGLTPGPRFKSLLQDAYDAQLEGAIHSHREAIEWVDRRVSQEGQSTQV